MDKLTAAVDLAVNTTGLLFLIFIIVIYCSKKNMKNIDNTMFKLLLVFNFLNNFIHIFFLLYMWFGIDNLSLLLLIIRGYWVPIQCYLVVMVFYLWFTLKSDDQKFLKNLNDNKKKFFTYLTISIVFVACLMLFLPLSLTYDKGGELLGISGICSIVFYLILVIFLFYVIGAVFMYRKMENKQKILPFKVLIFFLIVGFALSAIYPQLCVTEFLLTILSYLMFHTIENPDLKLVNQLTLAKNEAEKANNAKSDFLSSMSHELRTPLNAIVGLSTMIKENSTDPDSRNDAADIYKASNNLLELVDGILDINKLESNDMEITEKNYNPIELFNSVIRSTKIRLGEKPIELKTSYSEDIPNCLYGDSDKIKIILSNLLGNAAKYTEIGSIKFSVDAFNVKDKTNLTFTVSDTGRGIPEDKTDDLFTKFYRLEEDRDSDIEGTGLGLSITKALVELLDGKITVNSVYGEGTSFSVTLSQKHVQEIQNDNQETEIL